MSFRLFVYYCALIGGWTALLGWALGRGLAPVQALPSAGIKGFLLGALVAFGLCLLDALWDLGLGRFGQVLLRVLAGSIVGCIGGLLGGVIGQFLYGATNLSVFLVVGWAMTGLLIGASIGAFETLARVVRNEDMRGATRKLVNGIVGGTLGGAAGGGLFLVVRGLNGLFKSLPDDQKDRLWSPSAVGFVALGMCIGLLIGLARVILKEAWVRVESGFRPGREKILSKGELTIGRAEACDIGLFGDNAVERQHAMIVRQEDRYFVTDMNTPGGTFLNGQRVAGMAPLCSGDLIQVGGSVLCFRERQKREA